MGQNILQVQGVAMSALGTGLDGCWDVACAQVVCDFCEQHLEANKAAFADPRMHLIINDARAELEKYEGTFDVIIGDLADPVFGGPCYQVSHHLVSHSICMMMNHRFVAPCLANVCRAQLQA